jgi:hypothetical protein
MYTAHHIHPLKQAYAVKSCFISIEADQDIAVEHKRHDSSAGIEVQGVIVAVPDVLVNGKEWHETASLAHPPVAALEKAQPVILQLESTRVCRYDRKLRAVEDQLA